MSYINDVNSEILGQVNSGSLASKISVIDNYIRSGHDTTSFIYFEVNNFKLDTRSLDGFKHYAISLENRKTGVGTGNQFTLTIAFHRQFSDLGLNINQFEAALSTLQTSNLILNSNKSIDDIKRNACKLKYGYIGGEETPMYSGMLLKYKVRANKQIVEYTLTGISGEDADIGIVNWYPKVEGMKEDSYGNKVAELMEKKKAQQATVEDIKELIKEFNKIYTGPIKVNPYEALRIFLADYNADIEEVANAEGILPIKFYTRLANGISEEDMQKLRPVTISLCRNQTPNDYIKYLVSLFVEDTGDQYAIKYMKQQLKIVDRWVYELRFVEHGDTNRGEGSGPCVYVILNKISSDGTEYDYWFKGYVHENSLLVDYSLDYDGTVALTVSDTMSTSTEKNAIYINSKGQISATASITNDMFVAGAIDEVLVQKQNNWLDMMSCANNCTMVTFGLPFEIPVSSVFKVSMYIDGVPHHESGRCFVTGVVDKISNGTFTTEFTMIRLPGRGDGVSI